MLYAIGKGERILIYRASSPPQVTMETLDFPARELRETPSGYRRWKKVTARMIRLTVSKGVEVCSFDRYLAHIYMGAANVPTTGGVTSIPKEYHSLFPKRQTRNARRRN